MLSRVPPISFPPAARLVLVPLLPLAATSSTPLASSIAAGCRTMPPSPLRAVVFSLQALKVLPSMEQRRQQRRRLRQQESPTLLNDVPRARTKAKAKEQKNERQRPPLFALSLFTPYSSSLPKKTLYLLVTCQGDLKPPGRILAEYWPNVVIPVSEREFRSNFVITIEITASYWGSTLE